LDLQEELATTQDELAVLKQKEEERQKEDVLLRADLLEKQKQQNEKEIRERVQQQLQEKLLELTLKIKEEQK
jgi:hypothetical protein